MCGPVYNAGNGTSACSSKGVTMICYCDCVRFDEQMVIRIEELLLVYRTFNVRPVYIEVHIFFIFSSFLNDLNTRYKLSHMKLVLYNIFLMRINKISFALWCSISAVVSYTAPIVFVKSIAQ